MRWLVRMEIGVWRSLFFWVTRRVPGAGPGTQTFSYGRQVAPVIGAFIFAVDLHDGIECFIAQTRLNLRGHIARQSR